MTREELVSAQKLATLDKTKRMGTSRTVGFMSRIYALSGKSVYQKGICRMRKWIPIISETKTRNTLFLAHAVFAANFADDFTVRPQPPEAASMSFTLLS